MIYKILKNCALLGVIVLSFLLMLSIGLFVLPYHATGSHSNLSSDLYSLLETIIGIILVVKAISILYISKQFKWLPMILIGSGLGLIASVAIALYPDIIDISR